MATSSGTTTSSKPHIPQLVAPSSRYSGTFSSLGAYIPSSVRYYLPASVQAAVGGSGTGAAAPGSAAGGSSSSSSSSGTASNDDALDTLLTAAWQTLHTRSSSNSSQLCSHRAGRRRRRSRARRRALYLCLGYTNGFQVWDVSRLATSAASARFQEVLSVRKLHAVRIVHMLEPAAASKPATSASSDSAAFDASAHGQLVAVACADAPNAPSCSVQIYAAATKRFVHTLRFQSQVHGITSNATHVAVSLRDQIFVFHAATLDNAYAVSCYPNAPGSAVAALGSHWLAYASAQPAPTAAAQAHADGDRGRGSSASSSAHGSSGSGSSGGGAGAGANTGMASASAGANMRSSSAAAAGSHSRMRGAAPPPLPPASAATGTSDSFMGGLWGVAKDIASGLYYLTDVSKSTIAMMSGSEQQQGATTAATTTAATTTTTTTTQTGPSSTSKKAPSAVPRAAAGCVVVRDIASRRVVARFRAHHKALAAAAFDSSGTLLATSSADGQTVHVHRLVPCRAGQHAGSSAVMRQTLLQHQDLFRLERGLTHAHVRNLAFSSDSMWLAATSARGTTHVFSLHADPVAPSANTPTTTTSTAAGAPPAAALGGTPSYARGAADDSTAGTGDTGEQPRVRTAVPHTAATVGSAASADAAAAAAAGLQQDYRGHALAVGSGPAAGSAQRPAYLAAWEEATGSTRRHAVVARGSTLRVHHAAPSTTAAADSSSSNTTTTTTAATATAAEGAGSAGGDSGEGGDTTTKQAAPASVGTTTVCCAHFAGTRLLVSTFGMLHRHTLGVVNDPHDATGATVSDAGGGVVAVREVVAVDTWDVHRRRAWAELHDLRQHSSSSSDDDGSAAAGAPPAWGALVDDELRAHWLSNAEILTHTPPVVPLWASPQFSMHPMSASAAKATGGSAASGGSLSTTDLFFNPRGTAAVVVRRSGPQPVLRPQDGNAGWGDPAFALSASIMDGHFGRSSAASSSSPSSSSPTPPPPPTAPSAPPPTKQVGPGMEPSASGTVPVLGSVLAAGIRQALETPLQDDFNPTMGAATASSTGGGSMDDASFGIRPSDMPRHPSIASASSNTSGLSSGSLAGATMADEAYFDAGRWTPSDTAPVTAVMDLAPPPAPLHPGRSNSRSSGGGASGSGVGIGAWDDESDWLDAHLSAAANVVTANKVSYTATATTATTATAAGGATAPTKGARSMSEEHEDLL